MTRPLLAIALCLMVCGCNENNYLGDDFMDNLGFYDTFRREDVVVDLKKEVAISFNKFGEIIANGTVIVRIIGPVMTDEEYAKEVEKITPVRVIIFDKKAVKRVYGVHGELVKK